MTMKKKKVSKKMKASAKKTHGHHISFGEFGKENKKPSHGVDKAVKKYTRKKA
jgi:hypothetical protein